MSSTRRPKSWEMMKCLLHPELADQICLVQCLDCADMLHWNLTVNGRWSSLSLFLPLLLFCLTLTVCDSVSVTLIPLIVSRSLTVNKAPEKPCKSIFQSSLCTSWKTHTHARTQTPAHAVTHIQTLKTNTQTPPSTPPTVTTSEEWSACGGVVVKDMERKWTLGRGDCCCF